MELLFGYLAGLLTLINPCVLPVLPIVLASSLQGHRFGPVATAAGMSVSYVGLGLFVASIGPTLGIYDDTIPRIAALVMVGFGLVMLVPRLSERFAMATAGFASSADMTMNDIPTTSLTGQFIGGILLGAVWSPCIGPTLGAAIGLASSGDGIAQAGAIMLAFALGVSTLIIGIAFGARTALQRHQALLRHLASKSKPILGTVFVVVGLGIFFNVHHMIDAIALSILPAWLVDLSVAL